MPSRVAECCGAIGSALHGIGVRWFLFGAQAAILDVVLAGPGIEEGFFARSVEIEVSGVRVPVARLEDLIVMKVLAARPTDHQAW